MNDLINNRKLVIYGAGRDAKEAVRYLSILRIYPHFCVARGGGGIFTRDESTELKVHRPDILNNKDHYVLIASRIYQDEMEKALKELGYTQTDDYLVFNIESWMNSELFSHLSNMSPLSEAEINSIFYKSCQYIHNTTIYLRLEDDEIFATFCSPSILNAYGVEIPIVYFSGYSEKFINDIKVLKNELIDSFKNNKPHELGFCTDCKSIRRERWIATSTVKALSPRVYPTPCNYRCIYCSCNKANKTSSSVNKETIAKYLQLMNDITNSDLVDCKTYVEFAFGELTIDPYKACYMEIVGDMRTFFIINGSNFDENIAQKLKDGVSSIYVSIDAGTRETYKKIKGLDLYDKVCKNLEDYSKHGKVSLKYIIQLGINDNENDYNGIIALLKKLNLSSLRVSPDTALHKSKHKKAEYDKAILELIYFANKLYKSGIRPIFREANVGNVSEFWSHHKEDLLKD